jgi:hypothetical protein
MKKIFSTVALVLYLYLPAVTLASDGKQISNDEIMQELRELRTLVVKQQAELDRLKNQKLGDSSELSTRVDALEKKKGFITAGNELIDQITLKGDFRVRYQHDTRDYKITEDLGRDRFRSRFRLGGVWDNKAENWQIGAGLATGVATDPTSTNDTWGETNSFDHSALNLDYAYASHKWNDFSATLGQMKNPYVTTWTMFDPDVRLTGLTLAYGAKEGVFATIGAFGAKVVSTDAATSSEDNVSMMYMGQVGYKNTFSEKGNYTVAVGYHTYDQEFINDSVAGKLGSIDPNTYGLDIADLYGDVSFPAGPVDIKFYGQIWKNFAADGTMSQSQAGNSFPETAGDNDMGWVLGMNGKYAHLHFGYAYAYVEADSYYGILADADFGIERTNKKGHKANIGYDVTKNWAIDINYFNFNRIVDYAAQPVDNMQTCQLDVSYKF